MKREDLTFVPELKNWLLTMMYLMKFKVYI